MKVAIVVQRYGADINGGAEQHARYVAEHLATHVQVEVLTTCAHRDYVSWKNELPEGKDVVRGVSVLRFPVATTRDPVEFAKWSDKVFTQQHSLRDELAWLEAEGPTSPALIDHIRKHEADYDFFIFFSFRYYHSFHGCRAVPSKAILVPTAERDSALGLGIYAPVFRGVRAFMYNSYEERALIQTVSNNHAVPGVVVGIGSEIPERSNGGRFRQKFEMRDRFAIYVGRIDENKGCVELFEFFEHYSASLADSMHLVLIGTPHVPIPKHPKIHHLGFLEDEDKYDAMAAAELLIMPSYLESLSMVALEAWAMGKPVLANTKCDVLQGQCLRSNAGLFYENYAEFAETMRAIDTTPSLQAGLGRNGRIFFERNYAWPVIEKKYVDMLHRLSKEPAAQTMEPMPGWFGRRRKSQSPADDVVRNLPSGPYREVPVSPDRPAAAVAPQPSPRPRPQEQPPRASRPDSRPPRDSRGGQQHHRPSRPADQAPRGDGRGPRPDRPPKTDRRPPAASSAGGGSPREQSGNDAAQGKRDQRRGRPQRRGRRPGGGGSAR
ncbi:MAG TPA: glycosyltransferase [Vicinamibacterales bacterium]|nr:glycosyltransferase [Vicinamibacterales bacterium]